MLLVVTIHLFLTEAQHGRSRRRCRLPLATPYDARCEQGSIGHVPSSGVDRRICFLRGRRVVLGVLRTKFLIVPRRTQQAGRCF
jgi:hypothetical protein